MKQQMTQNKMMKGLSLILLFILLGVGSLTQENLPLRDFQQNDLDTSQNDSLINEILNQTKEDKIVSRNIKSQGDDLFISNDDIVVTV